MGARQVLDSLHSLAQLEAFAADPGPYAHALATEVPAADSLDTFAARDALLTSALADIDAMIARAMRIRIDHDLASDTSIGAPTRKVFATTIVRYAGDLALLAERVREQATKGRAPAPDLVATAVVEAARWVLALRDRLWDDVLALVRTLAAASVEVADRHARDRSVDDRMRKRWSALRRDLEAVVTDPVRIASRPLDERLAAWPEQLDEPAAEPEPTRAELLELD